MHACSVTSETHCLRRQNLFYVLVISRMPSTGHYPCQLTASIVLWIFTSEKLEKMMHIWLGNRLIVTASLQCVSGLKSFCSLIMKGVCKISMVVTIVPVCWGKSLKSCPDFWQKSRKTRDICSDSWQEWLYVNFLSLKNVK